MASARSATLYSGPVPVPDSSTGRSSLEPETADRAERVTAAKYTTNRSRATQLGKLSSSRGQTKFHVTRLD